MKRRAAKSMPRYDGSQAAKRRKLERDSTCNSQKESDSKELVDLGHATMTDLSGEDIIKLQEECQLLRTENSMLKEYADDFTKGSFCNDDAKVTFCSGLP